LKYDVNAASNAAFFTIPEKDFEANLDAYKCNKNTREDILFANITLHFNKTNWGGKTAHEKMIQFQNKLYSVNNQGSIFNPGFVDSKKAYADLAGIDWFSATEGIHGIRGGNLIETDPIAKGTFLPNSTFLVIHDPATGKFTSALFVINNIAYKLDNIISQVTTETTLVDYTQSSANRNQTTDTSNWKTYTNSTFGYTIQYPADAQVNENTPKNNIEFKKIEKSARLTINEGYIVSVTYTPVTDLENYVKKQHENSKTTCSSNAEINIVANTIFAGTNAKQYSVKNCLSEGNSTQVYLTKGDYLVSISRNELGNSESQSGNSKITEQVLSTFKFTKQ